MATRRPTAFRRRRCRARRTFAIAWSQAAEAAGFEYLLIPVGTVCWEAWITGAFMAARSSKIKPLIAARPGYINPVLLAKMISTFDQMSGGRICINLIAGQNESEVEGEGIRYPKEERYDLMEEEVRILKTALDQPRRDRLRRQIPQADEGANPSAHPAAALSEILSRRRLAPGVGDFRKAFRRASVLGRYAGTDRCRTSPRSATSRRRTTARTRSASACGLQVICREREQDAWDAAETLVKDATDKQKQEIKTLYMRSAANQRVQELAKEYGDLIMPHLWTGITRVRPGAGIAVVGDPQQCAATLQQFIDAGCHSFCLSGYLHDEEAERFGRLIRPLLVERNPGRLAA